MRNQALPVVAYVAGYGRSGSTWLDILLGAHPLITSLGESGRVWELALDPAETCVCGNVYNRCPQWGAAIRAIGSDAELTELKDCAYRVEHWIGGSFGAPTECAATYRRATAECFRHLASNSVARVFVDSSNTAYNFFWRPAALSRNAGVEVRIIHLVRDPRAVLGSCMKGQNSRLAKGDNGLRPLWWLIALVGWVIANVGAALNSRIVGSENSLRIEYETLVAAPEETLDEIGRLIGIEMTRLKEQVRRGAPFMPGHLVAGNRMARKGAVFPRTDATTDAVRLDLLPRVACFLLARPLYAILRRGLPAARRSP